MALEGMVHALTETHRVLKPDGILVDLRPAATHRRVGVVCNGSYRELGRMREQLDDHCAANQAVAGILQAGMFKMGWRRRFDCRRVMDTLDEFRAWIDEFVQRRGLPPHDWLIDEVERALEPACGKTEIVVRGPLVMQVLRKMPSIGP